MSDNAWMITKHSQLAILLEVSAPKPGNVNRIADFSDIGYRHFLASAAFIAHGIYHAATQGKLFAEGIIDPPEIQLGKLIFETAKDVFTNMNKSNTILGTILLHVPLSVAISASLVEVQYFDVSVISNYLKKIIDKTTVHDTINLYKTLHLVNPRGDRHKQLEDWTDLHRRYDIQNPHIYENIIEDEMTLGMLFKKSAQVDRICKEWANYFRSTLYETLPYLQERMFGLHDAEEAIVESFVWRLSLEPDSHIIKRAGLAIAKQIQEAATRASREKDQIFDRLRHLDDILRRDGNLLNPGTTADLISSAIFCRLVELELKTSQNR